MTTTTTAAGTLRRIADQLAGSDREPTYVQLTIQPNPGDVAAVDAIAKALGITAAAVHIAGGTWHHTAEAKWGVVTVSVLTPIAERAEQRRERLAAELAGLDAQIEANGGGS